jgi:long-chain acyl-CoA synthetase
MFSPLLHLRDAANTHPDAAALISPEGTWTFAELLRTVSAVSIRLRKLGISPRQLVAIDLPAAQEWIITLALFHLANRSVSLSGVNQPTGIFPDAVLTKPGHPILLAPLVITIDRPWIDRVVADADADGLPDYRTILYSRDDAICRVILTSGTTGAPRAAELSVSAVEHRLANLHHYWTDARQELNFMALSSTGGFHTALASLKHATAYITTEIVDSRVLRAAAAANVVVLAGSPVQVGRALNLLREENLSLPDLQEVRTAGDTPTPRLIEAVTEQLPARLKSVYGSTEGGGVAVRMLGAGDDPADTGALVPGITLEIVDESGVAVALGGSGNIRYRGGSLASGYSTGDSENSFRRGWFYPGDRGILTEAGNLVLQGRTHEVVNVGGVKIDPAAVEAAVEGFPGVIDAATFIIEQVPGAPELGLAVVADANCDLQALDRLLRERLPGNHPTVFGQVTVIPRNHMGKAQRLLLTAEFSRRLNLG